MIREYQLVVSREVGFFSNVFSVLGALDWCNERRCVPAVLFDSGGYLDQTRGPNWWEYFFERLCDVDPVELPVNSREELTKYAHMMALRMLLRREATAALIHNHIVIRPPVQAAVNTFWSEHLEGRLVIGLHLRGTDKFTEHPPPDLGRAFGYVEQLTRHCRPNDWRLFVATDDQVYETAVRKHFGCQAVLRHVLRSDNGHPIHAPMLVEDWKRGPNGHKPYPAQIYRSGYELGLEALVDALLLAHSDMFLGCQSNLSYFASAYNPGMPWIHVDDMPATNWVLSLEKYLPESDETLADKLHGSAAAAGQGKLALASIGSGHEDTKLRRPQRVPNV